MAQATGIRVPARDAEPARRRLHAAGVLRRDLRVLRVGDDVVFPVTAAPDGMTAGTFDFEARPVQPAEYAALLPEPLRAAAPRAFDALGDIVIVKVPDDLWDERHVIGEALLRFHKARAVFHDHGVVGEHRTRGLERIAGQGGSATEVKENGVRLLVDPARAYYSPRLGDERARMVAMSGPGQRVIDLFGGVAPLGVQLAKAGCEVVSVDLNPEAAALAAQNVERNRVEIDLHCGDARDVARELAPADRVVMNLPHGARDFVDAAAPLVRPGGMMHVHAIIAKTDVDEVAADIVASLAEAGREARIVAARHVRDYSAQDAHVCFDVRLEGSERQESP